MGLKNRLFRHYFPKGAAAAAIRRMPVSSGVVLMYHEVLPEDVNLPAWTIVRESDFRWQMKYLGMHFDVVTMDQALKRVYAKHPTGKPFAVVTFDDGYKGNLCTVLPVMESMGLPFILFVATQAVIDQRVYWHDRIINLLKAGKDVEVRLDLDGKAEWFRIPSHAGDSRRWEKVQQLLTRLKKLPAAKREKTVSRIVSEYDGVDSGLEMLSSADLHKLASSSCVTLGCHTHGHELLDQLESKDVVETLHTANEHISYITGCPPRHFAYPNGNFNESVVNLVRDIGYKTAVTTVPGMWTRDVYPLTIPRIGIGRFETSAQFKARLSGYL